MLLPSPNCPPGAPTPPGALQRVPSLRTAHGPWGRRRDAATRALSQPGLAQITTAGTRPRSFPDCPTKIGGERVLLGCFSLLKIIFRNFKSKQADGQLQNAASQPRRNLFGCRSGFLLESPRVWRPQHHQEQGWKTSPALGSHQDAPLRQARDWSLGLAIEWDFQSSALKA